MTTSPRQTIAVTARRPGRLSRLKLTYPDHNPSPRYDHTRARELLARTGELPARKHALLVLLAEYRRALTDLATQPAPGRQHHQ